MTERSGKSGQMAIFLVLILAGLVMLFALNVDIFTSSRSKIRLQNAADASALALAGWQGSTLNLIGDLNVAHMAAICQSNESAIAGIVSLQRRLAFMGPTAGFKAANDIAKLNGTAISDDMTMAVRLVAGFVGDGYRRMIETVLRDGIRAGVDNAAIVKAGCSDPRADPDFYDAIMSQDFRTLCVRFAGGAHQLPSIPSGAPDPGEILLSGMDNACFGNVGVGWESGAGYVNRIGELVDFARNCGCGHVVTEAGLITNRNLFAFSPWCIYDPDEWRRLPDEFSFSRFPWLTPLQERYDTTGGGATVRVEGSVALTSISAQTNAISALAAAKALGSVNGAAVTDVSPPLVLPAFDKARLVPFAFGAATGRRGMSNLSHVRSLAGLLGLSGGTSSYLGLLDVYDSEEFRSAADKWYSDHGHTDADGCRPPQHGGTERGGGTSYGI